MALFINLRYPSEKFNMFQDPVKYLPTGQAVGGAPTFVAEFQHNKFETTDQRVIDTLMASDEFKNGQIILADNEARGRDVMEDLQIKRNRSSLNCPVCQKRFKAKKGLVSHMRYAHSDIKEVTSDVQATAGSSSEESQA